jgi:hypothetical protein
MLIATMTIVLLQAMYIGLVLVAQFDAVGSRISRADRFGFVPRWSFFAPTPGVHNFYLLYRIQFDDGTVGQWMSLFGLERFRSPWTVIWNPNRRAKKAIFDLVSVLIRERADDEEARARVQLSIPYLLIINYISSLAPRGGVTAVQFLVMENYKDGSAYPVFVSSLHTVER